MPRQRKQTLTDWRSIENDREKYAAYLCSREWAVLKEAVHKRAGGYCERCGVLPIDAVHHLTYERKYAERLEDLQGICDPCHKFTHGKSSDDPAIGPIHVGQSVYLAGKVGARDWRLDISNRVRLSAKPDEQWSAIDGAIVWKYRAKWFTCDYSGPFFTSFGHGIDHDPSTHGNAIGKERWGDHDGAEEGQRSQVFCNCLTAIQSSTSVIAWIEDYQQFGTIFELGFAYALNKPIFIGFSESAWAFARSMWFPCESGMIQAAAYTCPSAFASLILDEFASIWLAQRGIE